MLVLSTNNRIVSIVDDELHITQLLHEALSKIYGISIFTFNDSAKALEHFTNNKDKYVLIICELTMPGINGSELLKKIKRANAYVRTILMCENPVNDKQFHQYLKERIIDKLIKKPINLDGLYCEVNNQVHAYQLIMSR